MNWEIFWMCFIGVVALAFLGLVVYAVVSAEQAAKHKRTLEQMRINHEYEKELRGTYGK